jgi:hypothetical protein
MNAKLIEKISKLLALATSPNEHEARAAAEKANALLVQHNLSMADLNREHRESYVEESLTRGRNFTTEDKYIWRLMMNHFFVKLMVSRGRVYFLGTKTNVEVARYIYGFLVRKYRELWHEYKKENLLSARAKQSYYDGLSTGLSMQLSAQREATVARAASNKATEKTGLTPEQIEKETRAIAVTMSVTLTHDPELEKIWEARSSGRAHSTASTSYYDGDARSAGIQAGKNLKISRGLDSKASQTGKYLGVKE